MTEDLPKIQEKLRRGEVRLWKGGEGKTWRLWLKRQKRYAPGALLVFAGLPQEVMDSPKVLVRGLQDVLTIPEELIGFHLEAAREGGFVWRDRDGLPWHLSAELRIRSPTGRRLRVQHPVLHRTLWAEPSTALEDLVRRSCYPLQEDELPPEVP